MTKSGEALVGIGRASGTDRHLVAAQKAMHSPLLESTVINGAKGLLVNFTSSNDIKLVEIKEAMDYITKAVNPEASIKHGQVFDETMGDDLKITVIATGFPEKLSGLAGDLARLKAKGPRRHGTETGAAWSRRPRPDDDLSPGQPQFLSGTADNLEKPAYLRRQPGIRRLK